LPENTNPSIIYASGKSSYDFINGKQYFATIQTYTDVAGTTGASGASTARIFYCLQTPTLTVNAVDSTIDTTSCNITASYATNAPTYVTNTAVQYEFKLFTSYGTLADSSGIIIGSGTKVEEEDLYNISYNFTGLEVGASYYARATIYTVQGMSTYADGNTFLVNPEVPTLPNVTVVNDSCNGVINITVHAEDYYSPSLTTILVRRKEADVVDGNWITLCSVQINRPDDMNFVFTDFLGQYGKSYVYAAVPVTQQNQGGVWVDIEGGYVASDPVLSIFDGVFITDGKTSQKLKAEVGYDNMQYNQRTGTIETIGGKYPIVVTNSKISYYSGSISALIVPSNFYIPNSNMALDRMDMVLQRHIITGFLTNKRPKVIKDWNGNIWLVMFVEPITLDFYNEYGMGLVKMSGQFVEIGDVNNYDDLVASGLIAGEEIIQTLYAYLLDSHGRNLIDSLDRALIAQTYGGE
jgi:hypothetical protein